MISATTISPLNRRVVEDGQEPFSFGNALQFDRVNDYVSYSTISGLTNATVNVWINTSYNWHQSYISLNGNIPYMGFRQSGNVIFYQTSAGESSFSANGLFTLNNWHMITITKSGSNIRCFIDGNESGSGTLVNSGALTLNILGDGWNGYFEGLCDEVSIWNTALSATDIANLYNSGNGDYATNYSPANLQAYWRMNESGTATTAVDSSGNGNDGTLNNFPASGMWVAH